MKTFLILIQTATIVSACVTSVTKHGYLQEQLHIIKEGPIQITLNPVLAIIGWMQKECMV